MEQKEKKPFYKKGWVVGIGIFIILALIGSSSDKNKPPIPQTNQSAPPATEPSASVPVVEKQYQQVFTVKGTGTKKSEPFTITGNKFKIAYDCTGDLCQAFMYKVGSQIPEVVMNSTGATKDETIMYGSGEYYLQANILGKYTMTVYDYK